MGGLLPGALQPSLATTSGLLMMPRQREPYVSGSQVGAKRNKETNCTKSKTVRTEQLLHTHKQGHTVKWKKNIAEHVWKLKVPFGKGRFKGGLKGGLSRPLH